MTKETKTIGGRVWEPGQFYVQPRLDVKLRKRVDGYVRDGWGIYAEPPGTGAEPWFHLVNLEVEGALMLFDSFDAAAIAALIDDTLDSWPTYFADFDCDRDYRDDFLLHSGFAKCG